MDLYTAIGLGGVGFYVCSYALVQIGKMDGNGPQYSVMNVIAASMVLVSLFQDFNLASMVTQVTWITVGLAGLLLRARRSFRDTADTADTGVEAPAKESDSPTPVQVAPVQAGLPPVDPFAQIGPGSAPLLRVRPAMPAIDLRTRPTFNLRPDTAPVVTGRSTLGLQPDLAPVS